jgi:Protein of unknown function (DUF1553)/Protein of unknown function (DUF1549)/Concanavalin A-like lectin/glucanases superfamily/Planctomycete cytochrome C
MQTIARAVTQVLWGCLILAGLVLAQAGQSGPILFNRDIRPILSDHCFPCHGPDANRRKAKLRLDVREVALADRDGQAALVPGHPERSEVIRRLTHPEEEERMPPAETGPRLPSSDVALIRQWIQEGAAYQAHWAFLPPTRPVFPSVRGAEWVRNPIDRFVLAKLEKAGLTPSPEADRSALIRRLSFDLTGLPPTLGEVDRYLADESPDAYEKLVDRLLDSDRFGEHMAVSWLDAARYADTNGYNNDTPRYNWRWRDWVIEAFNQNKPYDQFIAEQIAGDLIPNATLSQIIATGFCRNHNVTSEGGIIDEEYRLEYVADRVNTTATVFLGLSLRCARCHDHKFDPISQAEYYRFFAFFNQVPEEGYHHEHVGNVKPVIAAPTSRQQTELAHLRTQLDHLEARIKEKKRVAEQALPDWERNLPASRKNPAPMPSGLLVHLALDGGFGEGHLEGTANWEDGKLGKALRFDGRTYVELGDRAGFERTNRFSYGAWIKPTAEKPMNILSRMDTPAGYRGYDLTFENGPISVHLIHHSPGSELKVQTKAAVARDRWTHVFATSDGSGKAAGVRIYFNGVRQEVEVRQDGLDASIRTDKPFRVGSRTDGIPFQGAIDEVMVLDRELSEAEVVAIALRDPLPELLAVDPSRRTPEEEAALVERYLQETDPAYQEWVAQREKAEHREKVVRDSLPTAMVMRDMEKMRDTFVLARGQYDKPGEKVLPGVPRLFPPLPEGAPSNRLGLARWLVRPDHPLTARVAVNRFWDLLFGRGIVETLDDFGSQGAWPTHPGLLDWLAVDFVESGWDVKALLRTIVTSATYRQSSQFTPQSLERDPDNRLLGRAPRYRMTAEMIRDNALALSGLLSARIGGPSVKPYQPPGLWTEVSVADDSYSGGPYKQDHGSDLYRRSVYTWWKRTCPPPALNTLDAPEREFCTVKRSRTDTPLQALVLLNDPTFVEASRKIAARILREGGPTVESRAAFAFRLATARPPRTAELAVLIRIFQTQKATYSKQREAARHLLGVGESGVDSRLDPAELAAWTAVAGMILNLDEVITKG